MLPVPVHVHDSYASSEQSSYVATFLTNSTELDKFTTLEKKDSCPDPQDTE
jgi:hypothetical protein